MDSIVMKSQSKSKAGQLSLRLRSFNKARNSTVKNVFIFNVESERETLFVDNSVQAFRKRYPMRQWSLTW